MSPQINIGLENAFLWVLSRLNRTRLRWTLVMLIPVRVIRVNCVQVVSVPIIAIPFRLTLVKFRLGGLIPLRFSARKFSLETLTQVG